MTDPTRSADFERLLAVAPGWANARADVVAVVLVGSWARRAARSDSDVDLIVITTDASAYLVTDEWATDFGVIRIAKTATWGVLTERRVVTASGLEIDFGIVSPIWAQTDPIDAGTARVVRNGFRILYDPTGLLRRLSRRVADDPFVDRKPTSHELRAAVSWDASYRDGQPPWDIGRPQPAFVRLASEAGFAAPVLDVGCGTGEHALLAASLGLAVVGVDVSRTAVEMAREKAEDRGIEAEFIAADALHLERLGRKFATVLDCGLFHTFDLDERRTYVTSLASVTELGATLHVLCFSTDGARLGPYPVSEGEIPAAFHYGTGWTVESIKPDRIHTRFGDEGVPAWLATMRRT